MTFQGRLSFQGLGFQCVRQESGAMFLEPPGSTPTLGPS